MPWTLNPPIDKAVLQPVRTRITTLKIQTYRLADDSSSVEIIWSEGFLENSTFTPTEVHTATVSGAQVKAAFDTAARGADSRAENADEALFEILEGEGLIPAGSWTK